MDFPNLRPDQDASALWQLQKDLLAEAENLLGAKGPKVLGHPIFTATGPRVRHTNDGMGAFAELSPNAAGYWPAAVFELAHESIHLLDPVEGYTNVLEEGIAVHFSVAMMSKHTAHPFEPTDAGYVDPWKLVKSALGDVFSTGKLIRERFQQFSTVTAEDLASLLPDVTSPTLTQLVTKCVPR